MSSEPKLESFISRIKKADLRLEELYNNPASLEELLWFFDAARGDEVAKKIHQEEAKVQCAIVKNLAGLYPLSKHVLYAFYQDDNKETDADFIDVLKKSGDIVASIKRVISKIKVEKPNITTTLLEYERRVDGLKKDIEEKQESLKDLSAQRQEVTRLQNDLDTVKKEIKELQSTDLVKKKKDLAAKRKELNKLKSEKEKLRGDIENINKQLQDEKENISDKEIIDELRKLTKLLDSRS